MNREQMRLVCKKQGLTLIFDKAWNIVKAKREDGSIAFDGPIYDLIERLKSGEAL